MIAILLEKYENGNKVNDRRLIYINNNNDYDLEGLNEGIIHFEFENEAAMCIAVLDDLSALKS